MKISIFPAAEEANVAATHRLCGWLADPGVGPVMLAAGQTPLEVYRRIGERGLALGHLRVFALDEYVGVPTDEPRNCANLIRRTAIDPWGVPLAQYFTLSSLESQAAADIRRHEQQIEDMGGLDVLVLGLGQNGHLGFNEPGSQEASGGRVLDLAEVSVEANRQWFSGRYAPARGVTVGLKTLLAARRIIVLAYGPHKATAVHAMVDGPRAHSCPGSLLQGHAAVELFLDEPAASRIGG